MHYFGSKERLFVASLELPVNPATVMRQVFETADGDVGETLVRTLLTVWDGGVESSQFIAALRSATSVGAINDTVRDRYASL